MTISALIASLEALTAIAAEFPGWDVTLAAPGTWAADWRSGDGSSRWCFIAGSPQNLLRLLRENVRQRPVP